MRLASVIARYSEATSYVDCAARTIVSLPTAQILQFDTAGAGGALVEYRLNSGSPWIQMSLGEQSPELQGDGPVQVRSDRATRCVVILQNLIGYETINGISISISGDPVAPDPGPIAFTSRSLIDADSGANLICSSPQTATVNTGLESGFGVAIKGTISFAGSATVNDVRTTGAANPWCSLLQTGTDTYDVVGGKA